MSGDDMPGNGAATKGGFALETRAESLNYRTGRSVVRRGDVDEVHVGNVERLEDAVYGEEKATIRDKLVESTDRGSILAADTLALTVNGRLSVSAVGWPENKLSGEDVILLGGALADTWTGGTLIAAAISDDLVAGAGVRLTAPVDVWVNGLTGIQERPGTAQADVVFRECYGTLFEREYGPGTHTASVAKFSGTVFQTQRAGFRPLMKTALGVRNLIPAAAPGVAPEPQPPAPPAEPTSAAAGTGGIVAANVGAGAVGTARGTENFQDMGRVAGAADDLENAGSLRRAEDTAQRLDELADTARLDPAALDDAVDQEDLPARIAGALDADNPRIPFDDVDSVHGPVDDIDEPLAELLDTANQVDARRLDTTGESVSDIRFESFGRADAFESSVDAENASDLHRLLDVDADNLLDGSQPSVTDGVRADATTSPNVPALESPAGSGQSVAPSLDDSGAGWSVVGTSGENSPGAVADAPNQVNYQHMRSAESGVSPGSGSSGQAVADADVSFLRRAPDDFDSAGIQVQLEKVYYEHRDASNWRALEAYGVVNDLREDLRIMVRNVGGDVGDGDLARLYSEVHRARDLAFEQGDAKRWQSIDRFLDWYNLKVYDASEDLAQRADEFNDVLTGANSQVLDPSIDKVKLQQWLAEQRDAALLRIQDTTGLTDDQIRALGREGPYYHQMWLAVEEGRNPLLESLDEIAYLRSVNNQKQVTEYTEYHRRLLAVLADPRYRVGAQDGADIAAALRPGLESTDAGLPVIGEDFRTSVLDAELSEPTLTSSPGRPGEVAAGGFDANRQLLENLARPGDLARPPPDQPHWITGVPLRRILFPTGDPGFEHLLEGSLATGSVLDVIESMETVGEAETGAPLSSGTDSWTGGITTWEAGIAQDLGPRFGQGFAWVPGRAPRFG